ncbi:bifunctional copper resistance protein CopD/cytochrome c oxidase assembly protein [Pseudarthrobacter sp. R1]|uniref:cytochrome c oxidase assembly protein n=1 Tax=Pseudarthrobacter sp. R1 TaxID=2944934 RepID=UPI00210B083A|nr:cytochrome c oxidase assembly protein [Pseudarthrobacter sp. R1]MCQ6273317.1 bifunctional copper resistance protein CopD/cytochrome c oxidase assembly protein [Pseudarthrobacter sp. R1]
MASKSPAGMPEASPKPWWLAVAGLIAVVIVVIASAYGRGVLPAETRDPGALVRWGYGIVQTVHNISAAATIGALVFAAFIVPPALSRPRKRKPAGQDAEAGEHPAFTRLMVLASAASLLWTFSAVAVIVFSFADIAGVPISGTPEFAAQLASYVTELPTGSAWLWVVIIASTVATATFGLRSPAGLAATAVLAMGGLVPMILIGHAAGGNDHEQAINSLGLHLVGVSLWFGGLIALAIAGTALGKDTAAVVKRFSTLAGFAFVLVVTSGLINAAIRLDLPAGLASPYGVLLMAKTAGALVLGGLGLLHRRRVIPALAAVGAVRAGRLLWRLIIAEVLIMGAVSGLAAALSRTPPPGGQDIEPALTPAQILTGYLLPPELTPERWFTVWRPDWLWIAVAVTAAYLYLRAALQLRRRGDKWPWPRALMWLLGLAALIFFTSGGPSVYGRVLFSAHMVDHMALTMIVPVFLVLGAPVTLALRALTPRHDGTRGPREWLMVLVHSRPAAVVTHPLFVAANFAGSIVLFYYSDAFGFALREHAGHELMTVHFLITGYLFVLSMIGTDPVLRRAPYPLRLLLLLATMAFHAFFGVTLMGSTTLLQPDWFTRLGRDWGLSPLADQQMAGAITWGIGEVPTLLIAIGVAIMWSRSDTREMRRTDRAADRNRDADLEAYNDMLAQLGERTYPGPGGRGGRGGSK